MTLPLVVQSGDLEAAINDGGAQPSNIIVIDLRSPDAFAEAHIPGAVNTDAKQLNRTEPPVGGLLPDADTVNAMLRDIGANRGDNLVAYDGGGETAAARFIWVMHAYGYFDCSYLDGGLRAWQAAGRAITSGSNSATATASSSSSSANSLSLSLSAENVIATDQLMHKLGDSELAAKLAIVDVRSAPEFAGTDIRSTHGGHVPGAHHIEWTSLLDDNKQLLDNQQLASRFSDHGIRADDELIVYCQTHQRSALTYVALKHLGYKQVQALDGAWSSWGNRDDTPIEQ